MFLLDVWAGFEVGDGAGELEGFEVGAVGEVVALGGGFEERLGAFVQLAKFEHLTSGEVGVFVAAAALDSLSFGDFFL